MTPGGCLSHPDLGELILWHSLGMLGREILSTCSIGTFVQKLQLQPQKGQYSKQQQQWGCLGCRGCLHIFPKDVCAKRVALDVLRLYSWASLPSCFSVFMGCAGGVL